MLLLSNESTSVRSVSVRTGGSVTVARLIRLDEVEARDSRRSVRRSISWLSCRQAWTQIAAVATTAAIDLKLAMVMVVIPTACRLP